MRSSSDHYPEAGVIVKQGTEAIIEALKPKPEKPEKPKKEEPEKIK